MRASTAIACTCFLSVISASVIEPRHGDDEHEGSMASMSADSHIHGAHEAPLLEINETQILMYHQADPISYWQWDNAFSSWKGELDEEWGLYDGLEEHNHYGKSGLMSWHAGLMSLAFFVEMPLYLFLKTAHHPLYLIPQFAFIPTLLLGTILGASYNSLTPDLYRGSTHGTIGWWMVIIAFCVNAVELITFGKWIWGKFKGAKSVDNRVGGEEYTSLAQNAENDDTVEVAAPDNRFTLGDDEEGLVSEPQEMEPTQDSSSSPSVGRRKGHRYTPSLTLYTGAHLDRIRESVMEEEVLELDNLRASRLRRSQSNGSDDTLHDHHHAASSSPNGVTVSQLPSPSTWDRSFLKSIHFPSISSPVDSPLKLKVGKDSGNKILTFLKYFKIFVERTLIIGAFGAFVSGGTVYAGWCRAEYLNGCMAHIIKGGIFFWYGLLTFGRYVGAFSEFGWAWNRKPITKTWRDSFPSAEFVESFVIFIYGSTNQFMERFGAHAGDPFTVKEIQHISIAVMFCWAGLLGMCLESKRFKNWLGFSVKNRIVEDEQVRDPASYSFSFNPFPALTIGITGVAMGAHHQTYQFQIDIHWLWGTLLAGFAAFRMLTYFFLFLRPPASPLPSRPPTEALASICLCMGGLVFIESNEQIAFAAMRAGADDLMAFLNVTTAFVCILFAWIVVLMGLKGWAVHRMMSKTSGKTVVV